MSGIEAALFGTLGKDAEARQSKNGKGYLRLNVAVDSDGDAPPTWVQITSFDSKAIERADAFVKGSRVYVEGRLSLNEWTGQDGVQHHGLAVMSWHTRLAEIGRAKPKREKPKPSVTETV